MCASCADTPPKPTCGGVCVVVGLNACRCAVFVFAFAAGPEPALDPELGLIFGGDGFIPDIGFWFTGIPGFRGVPSRGVECAFIGGVACGVADTAGVGCWLVPGLAWNRKA